MFTENRFEGSQSSVLLEGMHAIVVHFQASHIPPWVQNNQEEKTELNWYATNRSFFFYLE